MSRLPKFLWTPLARSSRRARYSTDTPNSSLPPSKWKTELSAFGDRVRLWGQLNASILRQRASSITSSASTTLHDVGGKLNKVTGYDEIEALKRKVVETEERISIHRQAAKDAKKAYEDAVLSRASCQREVNDLLQRKSSWTDNDVLRFTALVRQDHLNEQGEALAKSTLESREADVEKEFNELMRAILNRYHEEQVWSDKIRSASTYGSLLALGANIFVFILAIVLVEPYKRKRLAQTFEKRIEEVSQETKVTISEAMVGLENHFKEQQMVLSSIQQIHSNTTTPTPETPVPQERPEAQQNIPPNWLGAPQSQATKLIGSFVGGGATACVIMAISMGRS